MADTFVSVQSNEMLSTSITALISARGNDEVQSPRDLGHPEVQNVPWCNEYRCRGPDTDHIPLLPWESIPLLCLLWYGTRDWRSKAIGNLLEEVAVDSPRNDRKRGLGKRLCSGNPQDTVTRRRRD